MKTTGIAIVDRILGLGLKEFAKDATPEQLQEFMDARRVANDAAPTAVVIEDKVPKLILVGKDSAGTQLYRIAKDGDPEPEEKGKDGVEEENMAADARKRMHDMLDKVMDGKEAEGKEKSEQDDADMKALTDMFTPKGADDADPDDEKNKAEDAHPEGCRCTDCMDKGKDADPAEKADDAGDIVRPEPVLPSGDVPKNAFDGMAFDAGMTMDRLRAFRKIVAKSSDAKVKAAFDVLYGGMRAAAKAADPTATYGNFRVAAGKVNDSVKKDWVPAVNAAEQQRIDQDAIYANAGKVAREKSKK